MNYKFQEYNFKYFFRPGKTQSKEENKQILNDLRKFNAENHNFKYGLFDPAINDEAVLKLFDDFIMCVIYHNNEIVGFYYFMILNENYKYPLVQLGLVVIAKNKGYDIFSLSEALGVLFCYKKLGYYTASIITTVPKIVESFSEGYSDVWPNPYKDLARCPKEYKQYLDDIGNRYVKTFFPNPFKINHKRFTLILDKRESGFHDRFHYLPMAKSFTYNAFCHGWINYEENEDLIIIGKFDWKTNIKVKLLVYSIILKHKLSKINIFYKHRQVNLGRQYDKK